MNFPPRILVENLQQQVDPILMLVDSVEVHLALEGRELLRRLSLKQKIIPDDLEALQDLDEPQEVPRHK